MQRQLEIYLYSNSDYYFEAEEAGADGFFDKITDRSSLMDWVSQQKGRRIVLVDNDLEELVRMERRLEESEVHIFEDPVEALEQIPEISPDVVLSDVNMPTMTGIQLVKRLREIFPKPF